MAKQIVLNKDLVLKVIAGIILAIFGLALNAVNDSYQEKKALLYELKNEVTVLETEIIGIKMKQTDFQNLHGKLWEKYDNLRNN